MTPTDAGAARRPLGDGSFVVALLGFCLPPVGALVYFLGRDRWPLPARSAGRGAAWGLGTGLVLGALGVVLLPLFLNREVDPRHPACYENLKKLYFATNMYVQENGARMPDLSSPERMRAALERYAQDPEVFNCPMDGQPYRANVAFSKKSLMGFKRHRGTVWFYDADHVHDNRRFVAYADGRLRAESEDEWRIDRLGMEAQARQTPKIAAGGQGFVTVRWSSYQRLLAGGNRFAVGHPLFTRHATPKGKAMAGKTPYIAAWWEESDLYQGREPKGMETPVHPDRSVEVRVEVPKEAAAGVKSLEISSADGDRNLYGDCYYGRFEVVRAKAGSQR